MYTPEQVRRFIKLVENSNLVLGRKAGFPNATAFGLEDIQRAVDLVEDGPGNHVLIAPNGEQ